MDTDGALLVSRLISGIPFAPQLLRWKRTRRRYGWVVSISQERCTVGRVGVLCLAWLQTSAVPLMLLGTVKQYECTTVRLDGLGCKLQGLNRTSRLTGEARPGTRCTPPPTLRNPSPQHLCAQLGQVPTARAYARAKHAQHLTIFR